MARHKHWSAPDAPVHGFPEVTAEQWDQAPWCDLPTLGACDKRLADSVIERWGPKMTKSKDERAKSGPVKVATVAGIARSRRRLIGARIAAKG